MSRPVRVILRVLAVLGVAAFLGMAIFVIMLRQMFDQVASDIGSLFSAPAAHEVSEATDWPRSFANVDLAAGPVDLVVDTGEGRYLIRDRDRQRQAVETGFPDFSGRQSGLLFMSILFLSPPASGVDEIGLTFLRDGEPVAKAHCWAVICRSDPALQAYLKDLTRGAPALVEKSLLIDDFDEYLTRRRQLAESDSRFGPLVPATAQKFPHKVHIRLPAIYLRQELSGETVQAYSDALLSAFGQRFRDRLAEFEIAPPQISQGTVSLPLLDCRTGAPVQDAATRQPLYETFTAPSIGISISAAATFADEITAITDWSFLPPGPVSDRLFKPAMDDRAELTEPAGNPAYCVSKQDLELDGGIRAGRESSSGYYLGWTEIMPPSPAVN